MRQELKGSGEAEAADATKEQRSGLALSPMQKPCTSCVIAWQRECVFVCARATYVYNTHTHTHTHTPQYGETCMTLQDGSDESGMQSLSLYL